MLLAMSPEWNDFLAITGFWVGVIGLAIGVVGFAITIVQLRRTKDAAIAARDVAVKTHAANRSSYLRLVGDFASRLLHELQDAVGSEKWIQAGMRVGDLTDLLGTIGDEPGLHESLAELREFRRIFSQRAEGKKPTIAVTKLETLLISLHSRLDRLRTPFHEGGDVTDKDNA